MTFTVIFLAGIAREGMDVINATFSGDLWKNSAPNRTICIRDAISDLPEIENGHKLAEIPYDGEALTHFQRKMRKGGGLVVVDHVCKEMSPLVEARIAHIPQSPGADWRDLPNACVQLRDGTMTFKLNYLYR